jgi:hypothetical protein
MTAKITRKRALELAQKHIAIGMQDLLPLKRHAGAEETRQDLEAQYAELAAALAFIENMARQKEMHL